MMIRDDGDMDSKSDRSDCEGMPPLKDNDGDCHNPILGHSPKIPKNKINGAGVGRKSS